MQVDPMARHLAMLLTTVDLASRLRPRASTRSATNDVLSLIRRAAGADRVSLFRTENITGDDDGDLTVTRLGRSPSLGDAGIDEAIFDRRSVALLLLPAQSGAIEALGPLDDDEPFYRVHREIEPMFARHAALAPVTIDDVVVGVIEVVRVDDRRFSGDDLDAIEEGARSVAAAVFALEREKTVMAFLRELLPEVLDPRRAETSLPARVEAWIHARRADISEQQALVLAATIAELSHGSSTSIELAQTMLSAIRQAFVRERRGAGR